MSIYSTIRSAISNGLDISYKKLFIGPVQIDNQKYIQIHCDRHDLSYSRFFKISNIGFAVSKFLELEQEYKGLENKSGKFSDNFFTWT